MPQTRPRAKIKTAKKALPAKTAPAPANPHWTFTRLDARTAQSQREQLPDSIFDIHAHLYRVADLNISRTGVVGEAPSDASLKLYRRSVERQVGAGRIHGGMFFAIPSLTMDLDRSNDYVVSQIKTDPSSRGLILITPGSSREKAESYLTNPQIVGFKCYHVFSPQQPTFEAPIPTWLPEWGWELADRHGLVIMLHIVRTHALADPDNQRVIRDRCTRYPRARLILAHAARGFHGPDTVRGITALRGLDNVWFDTSGICEPTAYVAILEEFGPRKLMWGSDFPISERRGKCVTIGEAFAWINPGRFDVSPASLPIETLLVGLESTQAVLDAAKTVGLNEADLRDLFHDNASRLLGLDPKPQTRTQDLYRRAKDRIPGGTHLLSKRPEMFAPEQWPAYFREARGCEVWDLDGRHYHDMSFNAVGACLLGYRDPDVTAAVRRCVTLGNISSLNPPEEVELADLLCEIHPWAKQVRFARTGGEAAAVAVRIARATTDRSAVAVCGYHGWMDWYLAANLGDNNSLRGHLLPGLDPLGVPTELRGTALPFTYNDRQAFQKIIDGHGNRLAAVIMEPCRYQDPQPGFLEFVRDEAHRAGALLIFDEITIGWRLHFGGAHLKFGINPDLAVFGKSLGNGHAMAAVLGTAQAMAGAHTSFISSSYWTDALGPTAALAAVRKMQKIDVPGHVARVGNQAIGIWRRHAAICHLPVVIEPGYPCLARFRFDHAEANELKTLFIQEMLKHGFLATLAIMPTLAITEDVLLKYDQAVAEVFAAISKALAAGPIKQALQGPVAHTGFRRLL